MKQPKNKKNTTPLRILFTRNGIDPFSDEVVKVYDTIEAEAEPIFDFKFTSLLTLSDFESLLHKYPNQKFARRLYEHINNTSKALFKTSIHWTYEVMKSNGINYINDIYNDFLESGEITQECPIVRAKSVLVKASPNIYGPLESAIQCANQNKITSLDDVIYEKGGNGKKNIIHRKFTSVGKVLMDAVIFVTYIKYEKYLSGFKHKKTSPKSILAVFDANKKASDEFNVYLKDMGLNKQSSARFLTGLIHAAMDARKINANLSCTTIFSVVVKEFGVKLPLKAKPRGYGDIYNKAYKDGCQYLGIKVMRKLGD
jgi:hypothetical protein